MNDAYILSTLILRFGTLQNRKLNKKENGTHSSCFLFTLFSGNLP